MATVVHHRFTVDEYDRMIATGIVSENDRVELIEGEILEKMPVGSQPVAAVNRLNQVWSQRFSQLASASIQNPVVLEDSEPEPDVVLLSPRDDFYASAKPTADDVLLLVEVADSSLEFDRNVKGRLYARAAIADYWIVNLAEECVEVYRQPRADGSYAEVKSYGRGEAIEPLAFDGLTMAIDEILG
jgi:Uma2 family endonuclease